MFVHLNGQIVPAAEARVGVFDGGFMYGDGIYTTLRVYAGRPLDLTAHHERLRRHTAALEIGFSMEFAALRRAVADLVAANGLQEEDGRLRITVSRSGDPVLPLPLTDLAAKPSTVVMTLVPVSPEHAAWAADGITALILDDSFARGNFPHLKTLNCLATVTAQRRAAARGCQEAILTGPDGRVLEGSVSNVFLVEGGHLVTPATGDGLLAGRTRERIMGIAARENLQVAEEVVARGRLAGADEVFVVSSVREVLPVIRIDGQDIGDGSPGPVTRRVQKAYRERIAADLASG